MSLPVPSARLIGLLEGHGSVLVLTGAGVSRESGIATFRDAGGVWEGVDPARVATPHAFAADPLFVWRFYDARRAQAAAARPNPAHVAIAALEATGRPFLLATQNVDGLHERAGSRSLVRLHGSLWRVRCTGCGAEHDDVRGSLAPLPPRCAACGANLRPAVVWFEEPLPMIEFARAERAARESELVLLIGTSSLVYPAASLPMTALTAGAYVVEINPERTPFSADASELLTGPAGVVLRPARGGQDSHGLPRMSGDEKVLWLDATAGASGDMILGALVDLGAPWAVVKRAVAGLAQKGVRVTRRSVLRGAVAATKIDVMVAGHRHDDHHLHTGRRHGGHGRTLADIRSIVASADIEPAVRDRALVVFRRLVEAEGEAHGLSAGRVHLHEAGAADAIADVVGVAAALHAIGPDRIIVSPLTTGSGTVACAHGLYPVPGPATSLLLRGAPLSGITAEGERLTPTGAAILTSIAHEYGGPPAMMLSKVGHGAGSREYPERPNVVRAMLGLRATGPRAVASGTTTPEIMVVEFGVDDATPQVMAYAIERLFAAGALDVHAISVHMKKGRVGQQITALSRPEHLDAVARAALTETPTLGVRFRREQRIELERATERSATPYGEIRVKVGTLNGEEVHATPEYDDCAAAARRHGVPLFAVQQAAMAARRGTPPRGKKRNRS